MKPFDLQEALNGEPVMLRNGEKAFVKYNLLNEVEKLEVRDAAYPLIGYRFDGIYINTTSWSLTGKSVHWRTIEYDIIGMWEEPELTSEQVLEKAYQEGLRVRLDDGFEYPVIGKARGGSYLLGDERNTYIMWCEDFGEPEICREDTVEPSQKSDTINVTLPKPFKAQKGDNFWFITEDLDSNQQLKIDVILDSNGDSINYKDGNCFRTREDAQAWLDAMKNALRD